MKHLLKIRTSGNHASEDCTSGVPPVTLIPLLISRSLLGKSSYTDLKLHCFFWNQKLCNSKPCCMFKSFIMKKFALLKKDSKE